MIFNSKQLEELEHAHDSGSSLQDGDGESESGGEGNDAAMEWRRQLVDEAAEAVKRAKSRPVDPAITYEVASLLYDRESLQFGRVQASVPGYLRIGYLRGGEREYGHLDLEGYLTDFSKQKTPLELAQQLGMTEANIRDQLENIGLVAKEPDPKAAAAKPAVKASKRASKPAPVAAAAKTVAAKAPAKKKPAKKRIAPKASATGSGDPIDDPNTYIQRNYQEMSNREMAAVTNLSEHTIRRKLGEWGLKRKKKPKKAK